MLCKGSMLAYLFKKQFPKDEGNWYVAGLWALLRPRLGHGISRPRGRGLVWKDGKKPLQEAGIYGVFIPYHTKVLVVVMCFGKFGIEDWLVYHPWMPLIETWNSILDLLTGTGEPVSSIVMWTATSQSLLLSEMLLGLSSWVASMVRNACHGRLFQKQSEVEGWIFWKETSCH